LIFVQNQFFYKNPVIFSAAKFVSYLIILIGLFIIGSSRRKELGGYASFKDIMQALLTGEADIGFVLKRPPVSGLQMELLCCSPIIAIASPLRRPHDVRCSAVAPSALVAWR
jgi:hypothetical protein